MTWQEQVIELYLQGIGPKEIADKLGRSYKSVSSFLYRWRKSQKNLVDYVEGDEEPLFATAEDYGDFYRVTSGKRSVDITKNELRLLKQLYCEQKATINTVCRELGIPRPDFLMIKKAFGITKDDVPFLDEDLEDSDVDTLVEQTIERKKRQYFVRLQEKEFRAALKELEKYRDKEYFIEKIHRLVVEHEWNFELPKVPFRQPKPSGLMLEVPIVDLHLAKLAWEPETGENYDIKIAERRFMQVIHDVCERARKYDFELIVFPVGNDFFNCDSIMGTTTKGTPQDNDSRWAKMYLKGLELLVHAVSLLSEIAPVKVFNIPGNHDFHVSFQSVNYLYAWFRNNENVLVDRSPRPRKYVEFGKCLIGYTHGDKEGKRLFGNMQVEMPEAWGRTLYREWHTGHWHSERVKEDFGVKVRSLSSVTATDFWHYQSGFVGALAVSQSFVWDKERGLTEIWYSSVT